MRIRRSSERGDDVVEIRIGSAWRVIERGSMFVDIIYNVLCDFRDECVSKGREDGLREAKEMVTVLRGASFEHPGDAVLQAIEGIESLQSKPKAGD